MKAVFLIMLSLASVQNFVRLDLGGNSMGKTPSQIEDAIAYQKVYPDKWYVVLEGQDKWKQAHDRGHFRIDCIVPRNSTTWPEDLQRFTEPTPGNKIYEYKDIVLIIDDITLWLSYHTQKSFLGLFALRPSPKFNMVIFLNCHEPRNIPEGIKGYITEYHVYANEADHEQFKDKIPSCYKECLRASLVINEYQRLYPGWYDIATHTPYFPRIVVYKEDPTPEMYKLGLRKINCVNMDMVKAEPIFKMFSAA